MSSFIFIGLLNGTLFSSKHTVGIVCVADIDAG